VSNFATAKERQKDGFFTKLSIKTPQKIRKCFQTEKGIPFEKISNFETQK
jgi:hypothetical protein